MIGVTAERCDRSHWGWVVDRAGQELLMASHPYGTGSACRRLSGNRPLTSTPRPVDGLYARRPDRARPAGRPRPHRPVLTRNATKKGRLSDHRAGRPRVVVCQAGGYTPMSLALSVCQKMSEISSIVLSSFSATATSSRLLDVARAVHTVPEQLVQVRELLEVILGEEVGPQHHQVMLDLLGALLLDDDRASLEVVVVGVVVLLAASSGRTAPRSWPARGRRRRSTGRSGHGQGWRWRKVDPAWS